MPNVRCNHSTKVLSASRKEYLSGADSHYGRKQGQVLYCKLFEDHIYELEKIETHQELEIALPTELLDKQLKENDWELIGHMFEKLVTEQMGYENVSVAIHYRDETSGRSDKDNLHVHVGYVDRKIVEQETYDVYEQVNKTPYAINLATGKVVKKKDFKEDKTNHLRVKVGDVRLNIELVDEQVMKEFIDLSKKRKLSPDQEIKFAVMREEVILQATPRAVKYSVGNRIDKQSNHYKRMELNKSNACAVLNQICIKFDLNRTASEYGEYKVRDWKAEITHMEEQVTTATSILNDVKAEIKSETVILDNVSAEVITQAVRLDSVKAEIVSETTILDEKKSEISKWSKFKNKHIDPIKTKLIEVLKVEADTSFIDLISRFSVYVSNKEQVLAKQEAELIDKDLVIRYSNMLWRGADRDDVIEQLLIDIDYDDDKYDKLMEKIDKRFELINEIEIEIVEDEEQEYGISQ